MATLHTFIDLLLRASWQAAIAALLVAAVLLVAGRRLPASARHALWFIVVARLLIPVGIPSPWSLYNLAPAPSQDLPAPFALPDKIIHIQGDLPSLLVSPIQHTAPIDWRLPVAMIWAAGAALMALRMVQVNRRFSSRLRNARSIDDPHLLSLIEHAQREMGVRRRVECLETSAVAAPALFGLVQPRILVPPGLCSSLSDQELRFILLHELSHLKRHDLFADYLLALLQAIHWFNPILWLAFARCRADRELARDAMVLRLTGPKEQIGYGQTLIKLVARVVPAQSHLGLVGMLEEKGQLRRRIQSIASHRRTLVGGTILAILLLAILALLTLTDRKPIANSRPAIQPVTAPVSRMVPPAAPTPEDLRMRALLDRQLPEMRFDEVALSDVIDFLRDVSGANIFVDWKAIEAAGVQRTIPITARLRNIKFSKALSVILGDVGDGKVKLSYTVDKGVITISTTEALQENSQVQVYDIRDLLNIPAGKPGSPEIKAANDGLINDTIALIKETVDRETWIDNGGKLGAIKFLSGQLIITQTPTNHAEIVALLQKLRETRLIQLSVEVRILKLPDSVSDPRFFPATQPAGAKAQPTILTDAQVADLLRLVQGFPKASLLTAPRLALFNGQRGQVIVDAPIEPSSAGIDLIIQPTVSADRRFVTLDIQASLTQPTGRFGASPLLNSQPPATKPITRIATAKTTASIPDGQTLFLNSFRSRDSGQNVDQSTPDPRIIMLVKAKRITQSEIQAPH
jgi:beta-lactamase regulating signal transducer with metallopeptidase domain